MNKHDRVLILIDLQNDFFAGGALGVPGAEGIFPLANDIQHHFEHVIATKDWHPQNHASFASNHPKHAVFEVITINGQTQTLWPDHCVQNTQGAEFHPTLRVDKLKKVILKGTEPTIDSYSAFFDNARQKSTGLDHYLKAQGLSTVYIMGLATDYCVLYSVQDAIKLGFKTVVIKDGCFGIDKTPGDITAAFTAMQEVGALLIDSYAILETHQY